MTDYYHNKESATAHLQGAGLTFAGFLDWMYPRWTMENVRGEQTEYSAKDLREYIKASQPMTSLDLSEKTGIPHDEIIEAYLDFERDIAIFRDVIKCGLTIGHSTHPTHLTDMSNSLVFGLLIQFKKLHLYNYIFEGQVFNKPKP